MLYVLVLSGKQKKERQSTSAKICGVICAICGTNNTFPAEDADLFRR